MTPQTIPQTVLFSGSLRQAPRCHVRPPAREFRWRRRPAQGGRAAVRVGGGLCPLSGSTGGSPGRSGTRWQSCSASGSSALPAVIPMATTPTTSPTTRSTSCCSGRDPVAGEALASQPTISRFENGVGRSALYELARELAMRVIERHQRRLDGRARRITIDLDPTDDATHGAQQLTFFNGHYDSWCYLPLLAFLTFDREREQYLCAAVLRPGNVPATCGTVGVLCRLLPLLRQAFPRRGFSSGSTGALRRRRSSTSWMPSRGSTTWWRWPRTPCCGATPSPP